MDDAAFIAAPEHHDLDELYDYEYPIENMLIGIPSKDPDTIAQALRNKGWTEAQIRAQTYIYTEDRDPEKALQAEALSQPKFPHSVVVPIRTDV